MAIWRMSAGLSTQNPANVRGRTYLAAAGSYIDVPDFDAELLCGQGWLVLARNGFATADRPLHALANSRVFDLTLGVDIISDGAGGWLNGSTGASV